VLVARNTLHVFLPDRNTRQGRFGTLPWRRALDAAGGQQDEDLLAASNVVASQPDPDPGGGDGASGGRGRRAASCGAAAGYLRNSTGAHVRVARPQTRAAASQQLPPLLVPFLPAAVGGRRRRAGPHQGHRGSLLLEEDHVGR